MKSSIRAGSMRWPTRSGATFEPGRHIHLVLENEKNEASHLRRDIDAQWNDDGHHAFHVLLTGEDRGYYKDYAEDRRFRPGSGDGGRVLLPGRDIAAPATAGAEHQAKTCRRPLSCCSCRTTTRSGTVHSASG